MNFLTIHFCYKSAVCVNITMKYVQQEINPNSNFFIDPGWNSSIKMSKRLVALMQPIWIWDVSVLMPLNPWHGMKLKIFANHSTILIWWKSLMQNNKSLWLWNYMNLKNIDFVNQTARSTSNLSQRAATPRETNAIVNRLYNEAKLKGLR